MTQFDESTTETAWEIVSVLGGDGELDFQYVAEWMVSGGDDGGSSKFLAMKFSLEKTLPSKA